MFAGFVFFLFFAVFLNVLFLIWGLSTFSHDFDFLVRFFWVPEHAESKIRCAGKLSHRSMQTAIMLGKTKKAGGVLNED